MAELEKGGGGVQYIASLSYGKDSIAMLEVIKQHDMPLDASCWVVWDKQNGDNDFADCELAWCSFPSAVRKFEFRWAGMLQGNMANKENRIHPTQKPVKLYEWLLTHYAKQGDKILDTHLGSGSSRIAAYNLGFDFVGCEIDEDYFKAQEERFKAHTAQQSLFI